MKTLGCLFSRPTVLKTEMLLRLEFASFSATRILPSSIKNSGRVFVTVCWLSSVTSAYFQKL